MLILDGWGISPSWGGNALAVNHPKNINRLWRDYPHKVLQAFTLVAGKYGIVGDSRLGHSTIAAGRRIPQDLEIISESVADKSFYKNKVLLGAIDHAKKNKSNLHLVGMVSNGGVHSHVSHLEALLELCQRQNFRSVYIDAITDGIDSGQNDALTFIGRVNSKMLSTNVGSYSTVIGREYAMDRVGNIKKTRLAIDALVNGQGHEADSAIKAISDGYNRKENDFTLTSTKIINHNKIVNIQDNDAVIFFNFRSDRSIQLVRTLLGVKKMGLFGQKVNLNNLMAVTFTQYEKGLPVKVAFDKKPIKDTLGEIVSKNGENQIRIAESEKAAHVGEFFNCTNTVFPLEERHIIKSKKYLDPAMQTPKITNCVIDEIKSGKYRFILVNFANVDMMSHTGNITAAGDAIRVVDESVERIVSTNLAFGGTTIITADHGNIEQMVKLKNEEDPENKHTLNPVPFILITADNKKNLIKSAVTSEFFSLSKIMTAQSSLADIAPTILEIMEIPKPEAMTGHSLLNNLE